MAATLGGNACYLKTSFSTTTGGGTAGVNSIVRYIPPNPNFAAPPQAPCLNCSAGCGSALPQGYVAGGATVNIAKVVNPSDGKARAIAIHIPKFYDPNRASPLIFGFPGNADDAAGIEGLTGMSDGNVNPYGIMVYVTGYQKGFQSNPDWSGLGVDDVGFVDYLINDMTSRFCVDTGRLFATGHSNGGGFTNMLACDPVMSVKFAAFAFNAGACYTNANSGNPSTIEPVNTPDQAQCAPGRNNVPWLEIHGTADGTIAYQGGVRRGKLLPTLPHLATAWAVRQGLSSSNYTTAPSTGVTQYQFGGEIGQLGMITHYRLDNWGHFWAKTSGGAPMDGTPVMMDFFYRWSDSNRAAAYAPESSSSSSSMSTGALTTTTSTASRSTLSATPFVTGTPILARGARCPDNDGQQVIDGGGIIYTLGCGNDTTNGSLQSLGVTGGFQDCFAACENLADCSSFTFVGNAADGSGPGTCYLKDDKERTGFTPGRSGLVGAIRNSPKDVPTASPYGGTTASSTSGSAGSPGGSSSSTSTSISASPTATVACGSIYVNAAGVSYQTYCDSDTNVGSFASQAVQGDFTACEAGCASRANCQAFVFGPYPDNRGGTCFYKDQQGQTVSSNGLVAAFRIAPPSSSSTVQQTTSQSSTAEQNAGSTTSSSAASSPSPNDQVTSSTSSMMMASTSSSSARPSPSYVTMRLADVQCPRDDRAYVRDDYGIDYQIGCSSDTTGGSVSNGVAGTSFKDCFAQCDNSYALFDRECTSFAYLGGLDGIGGGTCYFKSYSADDNGFTTSERNLVAGIRISPIDVVTAVPGSTTSTSSSAMGNTGGSTTSSSMMTSSSDSGGAPSPPPYVGQSTSSAMGGMSSSRPMASVSSSSMIGGMTTSTSMGGMTSSIPSAGMYTSATDSDDQSSMAMSSSSDMGDMSMPSKPTSSMTSSSMIIPGSSFTDMTRSTGSSMTSLTPTPSPELPDESSFFGGRTSSSPPGPAPYTSPPPASSPDASETSVYTPYNPTDEPSYGLSTPIPASDTASPSDSSPASSTTSLEACPVQTEGFNSGDGGECTDPYGNTFNVTYGTVYQGRITVRAVRPNVASCLVLCDETPGCEAINYIGSECQVLTEVTGNYTAPGIDAVAATRPADASTTYTMPPTSMSSIVATSAPVSNGSPATTPGGPGEYSTPASQGGNTPGSTPAASTRAITGIYTPTNGGQPASSSNGGSPAQSTPGGGSGGSSQGGPQSYPPTNGQVPSDTAMPTMVKPSYSGGTGGQSSGPPGQTTINSGAGPVDASNSNIVPSGQSTPMTTSNPTSTGGGSGGGAGSITNGGGYGSHTGTSTFSNNAGQNNGGTLRSSSTTISGPVSTGAVCPSYDNSQYTDSRGSTYTVECNGTYTGDVLLRTNSTATPPARAKRQAPYNNNGGTGITAPQCMSLCDTYAGCIAINMDCAGTCSLLSSVASTVDGTCGVAARRISGGSGGNGSGGGGSGMSTITVCAARTGTMTVFTTATLTTCAANRACPA